VVSEPREGTSLPGSSDLYMESIYWSPSSIWAGRAPIYTYVNSQVPHP
jgi:hypothetical protein